MDGECGRGILKGNSIRDVAELYICATQRFRSAMVQGVVIVGLFSLIPPPLILAADTPSPAVLEKARQWYVHEIAKAEESCETAKAKLTQSEQTLQRIEALLNRASTGDVAGRSVALQAAATAKSAIEKNTRREERECGRLTQLRARVAPTVAPSQLTAMVVVSRGSVTVQTPSGPIPWTAGAVLQRGQTISTGPDGEFDLVLPGDGSRIRLGKNSSFTLDDQGRFFFETGRFHYVKREANETLTQGLARIEKMFVRFPMRTATTALAVRGTELEVSSEPGGTALLIVLDGEVAVQCEGSKEEVLVRSGQQVRFTGENVLDGPIAVDLKPLDRWWE